MTETSPIVTMNPRHGKKETGTVGLPIQGTRVKLVDLETGTLEVPFGDEGELIVQGPQVMQGYFNKPEETELALRSLMESGGSIRVTLPVWMKRGIFPL